MPRKSTALATTNGALGQRVEALEQRVEALEASRPGRKAKPMVALRQHNVCAIDPERNSESCPDASIFRYQMGCHGAACRRKQHESYVRRKNRKIAAAKKVTVRTPPARKASSAKRAVPKRAPTKRVPPTSKLRAVK